MIKKSSMKFSKVFSYLLLWLTFAHNAFAQNNIVSENNILATSKSPVAPVFKGVKNNAVLQIRIFVPKGSGFSISGIVVNLSESGLKNIENLSVFSNGSEPLFNAALPSENFTPSSTRFTIPISKNLVPGLNYFWLAVSLKDAASMDDQILVNATEIIANATRRISIQPAKPITQKRIGIAVKKAGDANVHTYRIPGMITTDKGTLIAVYDIRYDKSGDLPGNIDVGMSRSTDGGKTWLPMKVIMDMGAPHENNGVGDPSILFDPVAKKIWVSALWSKGNRSIAGSQPGLSPDETGQFAVVSSGDDGLTWTQPLSITPQVKDPAWKLFFPGPGNGIAMNDGKIVFPAQYWDSAHIPHSTLVYSDDHGSTWKRGVGAKSNTTESQLVETTPGRLMLNMRDNRAGFRSVATTNSMGTDWIEHPTSYNALPDPVCIASFIKASVNFKVAKKEILFFSNVNSSTARLDMTVKASLDLGESWLSHNQLFVDERRSFGYSALTKIDDNTIGLLYEGIRDLYFIRIPVDEIIK